MRLITECREEILADLHLTLLRIVYQEFRFSVELRPAGRHRWVAARRNVAAGLYAVVTDDLDELLAVLGPTGFSCQPVPICNSPAVPQGTAVADLRNGESIGCV